MKRKVENETPMQKVISVNYIPRLFPSPRRGGQGKKKRRQGELITLPVPFSWRGLLCSAVMEMTKVSGGK